MSLWGPGPSEKRGRKRGMTGTQGSPQLVEPMLCLIAGSPPSAGPHLPLQWSTLKENTSCLHMERGKGWRGAGPGSGDPRQAAEDAVSCSPAWFAHGIAKVGPTCCMSKKPLQSPPLKAHSPANEGQSKSSESSKQSPRGDSWTANLLPWSSLSCQSFEPKTEALTFSYPIADHILSLLLKNSSNPPAKDTATTLSRFSYMLPSLPFET